MSYQAFDDYQEWAKGKAVYFGTSDVESFYPVLGLTSEVGELNAILKRVLRGDYDDKSKEEIKQLAKKELGDILWYLAMVAYECDLSLSEIVEANKEKLESREKRNTLKGSGDDR
jgi:NTP pyrophosphatase (non-canonical NTP hydrolase)